MLPYGQLSCVVVLPQALSYGQVIEFQQTQFHFCLTGQEKKIQELLDKKVSYSAIGRILGVHRLTVSNFVKDKMIDKN